MPLTFCVNDRPGLKSVRKAGRLSHEEAVGKVSGLILSSCNTNNESDNLLTLKVIRNPGQLKEDVDFMINNLMT